jgi:hypothetical protein
MCVAAHNVQTNQEVSSIGCLRKIAPFVFRSTGWSEEDFAKLPDEICLCAVDVVNTLVFAGFKVWANPDVIPEYLFETVERKA